MTSQPHRAPAAHSGLMLRTLGAAGLYAADGTELLLGPGKPLALLVYLALSPGRRTSREFLMDLLWADLEPERARSALRQVLFHLRRLLGDESLPGTEELTLAAPLDTDRDRFLDAIERGHLERAVDLYTGTFLPAFGVPGGAAFEQWADLERNRSRAAFLRSAEILVRRHLNQSRFKEAQRLARRGRDEAPESEVSWRLLLETIVAGRDFVSAAVEAEALEQWAVAEGVRLEPATRAAIAQARQMPPDPGDGHGNETLVAELTGREREFSMIIGAWDAVRTAPARHLHLTAPPGLGKTRLLRDAVARLRAAGAAVIETRGTPGDRDIPYAFAGDLAMALATLPGATGIAPASAAALISLNPTLSARLAGPPDTAVGDEAVRRRIQALTDLVHSTADEQPFVLVIDDVHWVDPASYRLLEGVWSRLGGAHLLCLTAARPERLPAGDHVHLLPLAPLSPADVGSLVLALGSLPDDLPWARDFVAGLHRSTRGSPLLVLETLRLAMDDGTLLLADGEWRCPDQSGLASLLGAGEALRLRIRALPKTQVWLLALLATAGTPLPLEQLAAATHQPAPELADILAVLERQGLSTRTAAGWLPAHDEIAAAARDALDSEGKAGADRALGRLLVESAGTDSHRLLRGIRHLAAAGEDGMVRQQFRRYSRLSREQHDKRPFALLAAEVLADDPGSARATALARSLPGRWRLGLWTPVRSAAAAAVLLTVVLGGVGLVGVRTSRMAGRQRVVYVDSTRAVRVVSVDAVVWDGREGVLTPSRGRSSLVDAAFAFRERSPAISPDGRSVAWNQDSGDSTTLDIWVRTPAGTRRLTHEARDDLVNSWLPDGSGLLGMTNRWSDPTAGNYDIAVFDTATGVVRQITSGPNHDGRPFVSPDGTRIAFIREYDDAPARVCVVPFDAIGEPDCRLPNAHPVRQLVGWSSSTEVVLAVESGRTRPVVRYDWQRDEEVLVVGPSADWPELRLSPDGRWAVAAVRTEGISGTSDWIIPVTQPAHARRVETPSRGGLLRWWEGRQDATGLVDRIEVTDTSRSILLGASTRLHIRALTRGGTETPVRAPVRWHSSDTLVATVDSTGEVRPRARGVVTIEASLAGWRATKARFEVRGEAARTVLEESWDDGWDTRWITFGDPQPLVVRGPGNLRAFWNRGDGTYQTTAVLRHAYSATHGLGVELQLSTPIGTSNWQRARTLLIAGIDTAAFRLADQKKGAPSVGRLEAACGVNYPGGTGRYGQSRIDRIGGIAQSLDLGPLAETLASGAWWTLRIQILPDGRCGIAINGQVLWLSPEPIPLDGEFRLRLGDESAGTRLLHGPLQLWTGVRTDIDWSRPPA